MIGRVFKIGGSLLERASLIDELNSRIALTDDRVFVIVGGGCMIDAVRRLDCIRPLPPASTHWQCVDLLDTTFQIMHHWMPHWNRVNTQDQIRKIRSGDCPPGIYLTRAAAFYHQKADFGVPCDWRTTTDTIAVLLAKILGIGEVALLKSCPVSPDESLVELAAQGIVDQALPDAAADWGGKVEVEQLH